MTHKKSSIYGSSKYDFQNSNQGLLQLEIECQHILKIMHSLRDKIHTEKMIYESAFRERTELCRSFFLTLEKNSFLLLSFQCFIKLVMMFLIHWGYSLFCLALCAAIWWYVGHTAPKGMNAGVAAEFNLLNYFRVLVAKLTG